jgi:hypothetical protein
MNKIKTIATIIVVPIAIVLLYLLKAKPYK